MLACVALCAACGGGSGSSTSTSTRSGPAVTNACLVLGEADFNSVGLTVDTSGLDLESSFSEPIGERCMWRLGNAQFHLALEVDLDGGSSRRYASESSDEALQGVVVSKLSGTGDEAQLFSENSEPPPQSRTIVAVVRRGDTVVRILTDVGLLDRDGMAKLAKIAADRI